MKNEQNIKHFYQNDSGRLISVLTNRFGVFRLEMIEDAIQDAMLEAMEIWKNQETPVNPTAWIYKVAKNKILNLIRKEKLNSEYLDRISESLYNQDEDKFSFSLISEEEITDDQLRMIFTCCHPSLSFDSQVALTLKTLCGFSISEIASAFVTTNENINKRLVRARKKIRTNNIPLEIPSGEELRNRLGIVLSCIYFLFNESYNATTGRRIIKYSLFKEAVRLLEIVIKHPLFQDFTEPFALLALMQLNGSRFPARQTESYQIVTLENQDRSQWDFDLMEKGFQNLLKSTEDNQITKYHILASISSYHCSAKDYESTDWASILALYDKLLLLDNSAIVMLNRAIALSKVYPPQEAMEAVNTIEESEQLINYSLFYLVKAEILEKINQIDAASAYFAKALDLSSLDSEKEYIKIRMKRNIRN